MAKRFSAPKEIKRQTMVWAVLILILIAVIVVVSYMASQTPEPDASSSSSSISESVIEPSSELSAPELSSSAVESPPPSSSASSEPLKPPVSTARPVFDGAVPESAAVADSYFDDAVFIGDSLTVGLGAYGVVPAERVLADTGINLDTILTKACIQAPGGKVTVLDALKMKNPAKIYIMMGSNGIAWVSPDNLAQKFSVFLERVQAQHPNAAIYIETVLPVTAAKQAGDARYSNAVINEYNQKLQELAKQKKTYFLNLHSAFIMEDGTLKTEYAEADGMHMKKAGYQAMLAYLKTHTAS